jgi:hypothetical protein
MFPGLDCARPGLGRPAVELSPSGDNRARPQWLYGAMGWLLRPLARTYLVLRAFASLSLARSDRLAEIRLMSRV